MLKNLSFIALLGIAVVGVPSELSAKSVKVAGTQKGLSRHMAQKWINHFIAKGLLVKDGTPRSPIYFLNNKTE